MKNENNILNQCLDRFRFLLPIKDIKVKKTEINDNNRRIDGLLEVMTEKGKSSFVFEVKRIIKRPIPFQLYQYQKNIDKNFILFAEYVNPSIAEDLKNHNVNFIDCQGNIFIHVPNHLYIDVQGNKLRIQKEKEVTAIFQPKGLQLLLLLLTREEALNLSLRELARISGNSLGRTSTIMKELKSRGYVLETAKNKYEFQEKKKLFDKWLENYGERLRPKLLIGTYRISSKKDIREINNILTEKKLNYAFGGGTGAEVLTNYYRANYIDIYIWEEQGDKIIKELKLLPAKDYNLRLFKLYSNEIIFRDYKIEYQLVLPLLIYAELLYIGNNRELETAKIIFDKYLKDKFE